MKSLALIITGLSIPAAGILAVDRYININSQPKEPTKVSDPFKPLSPDSGVIIAGVPQEIATVTAIPEAKPSATAVSLGAGPKEDFPNDKFSILFDKISKRQASEEEIKEFNNYALAQVGTNAEWKTETGEIRKVPQIEGLRTVSFVTNITSGAETIYLAKKENPYGLKEGEYAGKFNPNVWVEDQSKKQTGGLVLIDPVVTKSSAGLELPLDISGNQKVIIRFTEEELYGAYYTYIRLDLTGKAPLTNVVTTGKIRIVRNVKTDATGTPYWTLAASRPMLTENQKDPTIDQPYVLFQTNKFSENLKEIPSNTGNPITEVSDSEVMIGQGAANRSKIRFTGASIRNVEGTPVFRASNTP